MRYVYDITICKPHTAHCAIRTLLNSWFTQTRFDVKPIKETRCVFVCVVSRFDVLFAVHNAQSFVHGVHHLWFIERIALPAPREILVAFRCTHVHEIALLFVFCFMIFSCSSTHWASAFGSCSPIKTFAVFIFQVFDVFRFSLSLSFSLSLVDEQNQCSTCPSCRQVSSEFPTTLRKNTRATRHNDTRVTRASHQRCSTTVQKDIRVTLLFFQN